MKYKIVKFELLSTGLFYILDKRDYHVAKGPGTVLMGDSVESVVRKFENINEVQITIKNTAKVTFILEFDSEIPFSEQYPEYFI